MNRNSRLISLLAAAGAFSGMGISMTQPRPSMIQAPASYLGGSRGKGSPGPVNPPGTKASRKASKHAIGVTRRGF